MKNGRRFSRKQAVRAKATKGWSSISRPGGLWFQVEAYPRTWDACAGKVPAPTTAMRVWRGHSRGFARPPTAGKPLKCLNFRTTVIPCTGAECQCFCDVRQVFTARQTRSRQSDSTRQSHAQVDARATSRSAAGSKGGGARVKAKQGMAQERFCHRSQISLYFCRQILHIWLL